MSDDPAMYDHYRADAEDPIPAGTYRVVGRPDRVTLLHVVDREGRRTHRGQLERVDRETLADLTPVEGPEDGKDLGTALYYSARAVPKNLLARPGQTLLGTALVLAVVFGPNTLPAAPELLWEGMNLLGALVLGAAAAGIPGTGR